ncbi:hypothetical protein HWV62_30089 [Athelia sp. TMB]|nr:hypothetical protein HWV62_30089 [Athelia sp. TMB]
MSPSPRLPGYIPGMPRPMTPRESFEGAEQARSHSTTPRPTSPFLPSTNGKSSPLIQASIAASLMGRNGNGSAAQSSRTHNGSLSIDAQRSYDSSTDESVNSNSSAYTRHRPASPLAGPAYQPMAVPPRPTTPSNIPSRPSTPSNITWNTSTNSASSRPKTHSRNASESSIIITPSPERSASVAGRSLRSPAFADSPLIDHDQPLRSSWDEEASSSDSRAPVATRNIDLGSPVVVSNRSMHSPTPTQSRSPAPTPLSLASANDVFTASASRRGSRQQDRQSPFDFGRTYPLAFSPIAKSSRSSFASEGSSYHSDDGMNKLDCDFDFFREAEEKPCWHDVSGSDITAIGNNDDLQDDSEAEEFIRHYAGLTKADFVAIQEKLVTAAVAKASTPDPRERAPSLRRRRPSTSQSNYSLNGREIRVASPPPQVQTTSREISTPQKVERPMAVSVSPASVASMESPSPATNAHRPTQSATLPTRQQRDLSPTTRRNRDLAEAIFGDQSQDIPPPTQTLTPPSPLEKVADNTSHHFIPSTPPLLVRSPSQIRSPTEEPTPATPSSQGQSHPIQLSRNASILRSPRDIADSELVLEVQRKTEAATASLKRGPSVKYHDNGSSLSIARKRIAPHQISSPHLVSASTSLDTIPVRSPSVSSNNAPKTGKLGSRLRKWGTLRGKPTIPNGDEVTPFLLEAQAPPTQATAVPTSGQTAQYASVNPSISQPPASASLAEPVRSKAPIPSPPATAGPGIKGFMSRFRKPSKTSDASMDISRTSPDLGSGRSAEQARPRQPLPEFTFPQPTPTAHAHVAPNTPSVSVTTPTLNGFSTQLSDRPVAHHQNQSSTNHSLALKQLFDAATTIGLDQTALNELLQRSGSTSSNMTMLTRNDSSFTTSTLPSPNEEALSRSRSPYDAHSHTNLVAPDRVDDAIKPISAVPRKHGKAGDNDSASNAVVRRTLIFPSESRTSTIDLNILMRKNSTARRRRSASAASVTSSSRSVHDRAPTPPPPRSPTGRRFSHDASPPVPQLPTSLSAQAESLLPIARPRPAPAGVIEKSNSAYESLARDGVHLQALRYEMYASDRVGSGGFSDSEIPPDAASLEPTRAVEVVELANGETIWSIVNGLRDDDVDSLYASRSSFASDYSPAEPGANGVQVLFKEHNRTGSKGSTSSFLSRKKSNTGKNRPETKIFYSSSNQIGRLIENLSEGQDAGSFNFTPSKRPGHSAKSSFQSDGDINWTVEERLEHMLGSMKAP